MQPYTPPSTLDGIKRLAKKLKKEFGITHKAALEKAAGIAGYQTYEAARLALQEQ